MLLNHRPRPHAAQELVLGDQSAPRLDQSDENIEGPAADRYGQPIREKLTAVRIETKAAKFHHPRASNDPRLTVFFELLRKSKGRRLLATLQDVKTTRRARRQRLLAPRRCFVSATATSDDVGPDAGW